MLNKPDQKEIEKKRKKEVPQCRKMAEIQQEIDEKNHLQLGLNNLNSNNK